MLMTVEQINNICNQLNICFTTYGTRKLIRRSLKKVQRPSNYSNTRYSFLVDAHSFKKYLIDECNIESHVAYKAIYERLYQQI